ncbi:cytochrome P450 [Hysterangium stoloniferum]|nr:cytochrome P450 [Hysterangium stoloniferum]
MRYIITNVLGLGILHLSPILLLVLILCSTVWRKRRIPKGLRLPPGPPSKSVFGHGVNMPTEQEWRTFSDWAKIYGDLFYVNVLGYDMIFINSADVAYNLFEKTSSIYSDRCEFPMLVDLIGFDWHFAFMHYGNWWRRHRRVFHQKFHPTASAEYHPIQLRQTRELLRRLHETPKEFTEHFRHTAGAIIMEIIYGIKVAPKDDHYITTAESGMYGMTVAGNFGTFLVDSLPILKYVPLWFPGASFKRKAAVWKKATTDMSVIPFEAVKKAMANGNAPPSFTSSLLEELSYMSEKPPNEEDVIRGAGSSAYAAGSDTTVSALHIFMLAMVCYPEVQRKAQEELDKVIGAHRLPDFGDRESLPYIELIVKELYRWHPVVPLGVAHAVTQDDIYGEFFIPKGAIIVGNVWHILHDEKMYGPDTDKFIPERFLKPGVKEPTATFGFGRRICPGRYMADNSVFIAIALILKAFTITPAEDTNGNPIPIKEAFTSGFMSHPEAFQCQITARSEIMERLIYEKNI